MSSASELEQLVFQRIAPNFERDGYEFVHPTEVKLPSSRWHYFPDFIAKKGNEYVAIEVKSRRTRSGEKSLETLKGIIEENKNWKFRVFYAEEELEDGKFSRPKKEIVLMALDEVRKTNEQGYHRAAFLLAWGVLEASAREAHSRIFAKPQTPGRIITILAESGSLIPDDAERLRGLARKRNSLIHGGLEPKVTESDVEFIITLASKIVR